jgi:formamidopyrimidine-DNA glycosylase
MPELPDINAYLCALDTRIVGRTLDRVRVASAFVLRTAQPPIADVQGQVVRELRRIGKRVVIGLNNDLWVVIHLSPEPRAGALGR